MITSHTEANIKNTLSWLGQGGIFDRFMYAAFVILGVLFYGIGTTTAYSVFLRLGSSSTALEPKTFLFACYVIVNFIIGYGFMFRRKWLLSAFFGSFVSMILVSGFFFILGDGVRASALFTTILILGTFSGFLFASRKFMVGKYLEPLALSGFFLALFLSFFFNFFML